MEEKLLDINVVVGDFKLVEFAIVDFLTSIVNGDGRFSHVFKLKKANELSILPCTLEIVNVVL